MESSPFRHAEIPSFEKGFPVGLHPDNPDSIASKETDGPNVTFYYNKEKTKRIFDFVLSTGARIVTLDIGSDDGGWSPLINLNINNKPWTEEEPQYKLRISHFDYEGGNTHVARIAVKPNGEKVLRNESIIGNHDVMNRLYKLGMYSDKQIPDKFDFDKTVDSLITQLVDGDMSIPKLIAAT